MVCRGGHVFCLAFQDVGAIHGSPLRHERIRRAEDAAAAEAGIERGAVAADRGESGGGPQFL